MQYWSFYQAKLDVLKAKLSENKAFQEKTSDSPFNYILSDTFDVNRIKIHKIAEDGSFATIDIPFMPGKVTCFLQKESDNILVMNLDYLNYNTIRVDKA